MNQIELIESRDWKIDNRMDNNQRLRLSTSAYYLDRWYNDVKDLTFETVIVPITTSLEDLRITLPFSRIRQ